MKHLIGLLLLFLTVNIYSQRTEMMLPFYENGKWGYMNKTKEIIIEPKFEEAFPSYLSRFRVKYNGKYGYLDRKGQVVIKPIYEEASDFEEGKANVTLKGVSFDIGLDGEKMGEKTDRYLYGDCGSHRGLQCFLPTTGSEVFTYEIIDIDGKLSTIYNYGPVRKLNKNKYNTLMYDRDEQGNVQYKYQDTLKVFIDSIIPFTEQWIYVVKDSHISFLENESMLQLDYLPEILSASRIEELKIFECEIDHCSSGKSPYIGVKENGLWGYYFYERKLNGHSYGDAKIKEHIEAKYHSISSLGIGSFGSALVEYEIGKFGYIDNDGNEYFIR